MGASVWYPCKDHQSDEPDNGASLTITVPDTLVAVSNGRLKEKKSNNDGTVTWRWEVKNPINNYNIVPYIGKYVNFTDTLNGEKGKLDLSFWVLDYNLEKAKQQFDRNVKPMLHCFEYWMGPYPFYEDSYKLVESSHLGMEHQSATAYGNHYMNGYLGMDLSGSGWGKNWDYIIVHESGHEWFANNITTNDIADMWVHEGITDYSETLFVECQYGKEAANEYTQGLRKGIHNDKPIIGPYGVNQEGSNDMYDKGNNIMHTIRQIINNDSLFRNILSGLNKDYYHKTVDSKDIENYISRKSGIDFSEVFDHANGFDVIIANPPYEEISEKTRKDYFKKNYAEVLSGHYDLYIFFFRRAFRTQLNARFKGNSYFNSFAFNKQNKDLFIFVVVRGRCFVLNGEHLVSPERDCSRLSQSQHERRLVII